MKFLEEHRLAITPLTPVHIGCGEDYTPTDYVIDGDALFAFRSAGVGDALSEAESKQLMGLVKDNRQDEALRNIQGFFYKHREKLMTQASHWLPVAEGAINLYEKRVGQTAQLETTGKKVVNRLEIERTFYNPASQKPVIPGSSLKGAIRTALLDMENNGNPCQRDEERRDGNKKLQQRLFKYENKKLEKDPMRLVHLDDTQCGDNDVLHSEIRFAVNRPRQEPKQKQAKNTMAEDKGLYQLLETLSCFTPRAYSSRLTIQKVNHIRQNDKLPEKELRWTIEDVADACNRFYLPLLEQEIKIIKEKNYASPGWLQGMDELLADIEPLLQAKKAMILRVGRHSGAEAVTLNGLRNVKIMQGQGKPPKYESKPRTLWLAADIQDARSEMLPFGWVLIEIDPDDEPPAALVKLTRQGAADRQSWSEKQLQRLTELRDKLTEKKRHEEAQRQEQAAEEQAARQKQERLATMTGEQREIEELRRWFEQDRRDNKLTAQSRVPGRLAEIVKRASDWPKEDRVTLCELAVDIYKPLGMLKGPKGRERKAKIEQLRE